MKRVKFLPLPGGSSMQSDSNRRSRCEGRQSDLCQCEGNKQHAGLDFFANEILGRHEAELRQAILPMVYARIRFRVANRTWGIDDALQETWLRALQGELAALPSLADALRRAFESAVIESGKDEASVELARSISSRFAGPPMALAARQLTAYLSQVVANLASDSRKTESRRATRRDQNAARVLVYSASGPGAVSLGDSYHIPHATELTALAKARLECSTNLYLSQKPGLAAATKRYIRAFVELILLAGESIDNAMELLEDRFGPPPLSRMSLYRCTKGISALMNGVA
jgi:DNA-directed RNA polymerase specialized sigma24 family protein